MVDWMRGQGWQLPERTLVIPLLTRSAATGESPPQPDPHTDGPVDRLVFFGRLEERKGVRPFAAGLNALSSEQLRGVDLEFLGRPTSEFAPARVEALLSESTRHALRSVSFETELDQHEALERLSRPGTLAVIPSLDQFAFVVRKQTGLTSFEDIALKRSPLKVSVRGQKDHSLHFILEHVMQAAGFSSSEFLSWGGELRKEGSLPYPDSAKFAALARGEIDAIFDEGIYLWLGQALALDVTVLPLSEATVRKVEAKGCRRAVIEKSVYPRLPGDVLTVDFSGWPIFVHADAPDKLVTQFCTALEARKDRIPWEGEGPLPTHRMCRDAPENPLDVPLHPAAEAFWRKCGYL